jgi:hypothetical protein
MAARNSAAALALASLLAGGCAPMTASECSGANWYELGYRDGLFGIQRHDEAYAFQCEKAGAAAPDRAQYAKGWQEGWWEFERRKIHGGSE